MESVQYTCSQYKAKNFLAEISNNIEHVMRVIESPKENIVTKEV